MRWGPPSEAWEPWWYRFGMALVGLTNIAGIIAFDWVIAYGDWPAGSEMQRLQYLFYGHMAHFALLGLQLWGLVSRNLARVQIKAELAKLGKIELG